jgi:hypothetical protein
MSEELPSHLLESFYDLARLYLQRELLISKLSDAEEVTLTMAEEKVSALIKPHLQGPVKMLDRWFLTSRTSKDTVRMVAAYRYRLNYFIDHTIGMREYSTFLRMDKDELQKMIAKLGRKLDREPVRRLLEAQLAILLRWSGR